MLKNSKVDNRYSVTFLVRKPIFESHVDRCTSKNKYQKGMYLTNIELCAQNLITLLDSTINIIRGGGGDLYDNLMSTRILTLIMNKIFI